MTKAYRTKDAATRLAELGRPTSTSYLQKARTRGADDPRDKGPDFYRDPAGKCWYTEEGLARYAAERLSALRLRASAPQPENFRRRDPHP